MDKPGSHRPRNVGWARAAAFLYGDWGTSKAYVIGLAFVAAGFSSLPTFLSDLRPTGAGGYKFILNLPSFSNSRGGIFSVPLRRPLCTHTSAALHVVPVV